MEAHGTNTNAGRGRTPLGTIITKRKRYNVDGFLNDSKLLSVAVEAHQ